MQQASCDGKRQDLVKSSPAYGFIGPEKLEFLRSERCRAKLAEPCTTDHEVNIYRPETTVEVEVSRSVRCRRIRKVIEMRIEKPKIPTRRSKTSKDAFRTKQSSQLVVVSVVLCCGRTRGSEMMQRNCGELTSIREY